VIFGAAVEDGADDKPIAETANKALEKILTFFVANFIYSPYITSAAIAT
jgi:hypothetical protein